MNDGRQSHNADLAQTSSEQSESSITTSTANHYSNVCVNRVFVKVPPFWPEHTEIWFAQVKAQFSISGINNDISKFNTVVSGIESNVLSQICDAI